MPAETTGAGASRRRRALFAGCLLVIVVLLLEALLFAAEHASERVAVVLRGTSRAVPDERLGQRGNPQVPDRGALAEAGIPFVDTPPALRALVAEGRNPYRSDHNGHPLAAGNEVIAEAVLVSGVLDAPPRGESPGL